MWHGQTRRYCNGTHSQELADTSDLSSNCVLNDPHGHSFHPVCLLVVMPGRVVGIHVSDGCNHIFNTLSTLYFQHINSFWCSKSEHLFLAWLCSGKIKFVTCVCVMFEEVYHLFHLFPSQSLVASLSKALLSSLTDAHFFSHNPLWKVKLNRPPPLSRIRGWVSMWGPLGKRLGRWGRCGERGRFVKESWRKSLVDREFLKNTDSQRASSASPI